MAQTARHEIKYVIAAWDAPVLMNKLARVLALDENANGAGEYMVRSLYFDDLYDHAYFDKIDGLAVRDKYRIRTYKLRDEEIFLERKRKVGALIQKESVRITRRLAEQLMAGECRGLDKMPQQLLQDVFVEMRLHMLRPKVIVDYERTAYLHPAENVRITFDKRVRSGAFATDMFNPNLMTVPVIDQGKTVLEVKFDRYLPDFIPPLLASIPAEKCAISKYVLCRQYAL